MDIKYTVYTMLGIVLFVYYQKYVYCSLQKKTNYVMCSIKIHKLIHNCIILIGIVVDTHATHDTHAYRL